MKLRACFALATLMVSPFALHAAPSGFAGVNPGVVDRPGDAASQFTVTNSTQIPGQTLKPGEYTIRILDHLSDRMVIRVEDSKGKTKATFLALPSSSLSSSGHGPIGLGSGASAKAAMRGFSFSNGTTAEFVYPKAEAVGLAKANGTKIVAIDPASEGRPTAAHLSSDDLQMVTLWMLSPTVVGPDAKPGIAAERYHAPQTENAAVQTPAPVTSSARATAPRATAPDAPRATTSDAPRATTQVASVQVPPRPVRKAAPVMRVLPHTASSLPLLWACGLGAFAGALLLTGRRWFGVQA